MILDTTSKTMQIVLAEAKTTNNCNITAAYVDVTTTAFTPGNNNVESNGTSPVTVVAAPSASTQRQVKEIWLYNNDTVTHNVILQLYDGSNTWILEQVGVAPEGSFRYTPDAAIYNSSGAVGANPSANVGLTVVDGSAATFMRSDAAPPIDVSIAPTWTGIHTFSNEAIFNSSVSVQNYPFEVSGGPIIISGQNYLLQGETSSFGTPLTQLFQQIATSDGGGIDVGQFTADANGPVWNTLKSRSTTVGSFAALQANDVVGQFGWYGDDGTTYNNHIANLQVNVDGTVSTGIIPGAIYFRTQNTSGALKTAVKIDSAQSLLMGTSGTLKIADNLGNLYAVNETISGVRIVTNTSYQALSTGFSITLSSTISETVNTTTSTLATGTVELPTTPVNGQITRFTTCGIVTALTVSVAAGQSVVAAPSTLAAATGISFKYKSANTTWYPTLS